MQSMRRACLLTFWIMLLAFPAWAMEHYTNVLQDQYGRAIGGASVTVYLAETGDLATIYSDNGTTVKDNPFTTNVFSGVVDFYAENGVYNLVFAYPGKTFTANDTRRISLFDYHDLSVTAFPASPFVGQLVVLISDSTAGSCVPGGSEVTPCVWTGAEWAPVIGSGGGGGGSQGLGDVIAEDRTYGGAVSQATAPRFGDSVAGEYWLPFRDPTAGLIFTCEVNGVLEDCHKGTKLLNGKFYRITNQSDVVVWEVDYTGALTEGSINVETAGVTLITTEEHWWDVAACQNTTASLIWDVPTANSPAAACDTGTNTQKGYASFDASTDESFQMNWVLPNGFTGAIDVHFIWKAAATTGAVGWCAQLIRVQDASTSDPAFPAQGAGNCVSDTAKGTTLQENHATITGVTCSNCASRDHVYVRISRDANGGAVTDDMAGDAHLMKVGRTWRVAK